MKIKKITSVMLSMLLMFTVVCGCFAVTANAASQITYSYVITSNDAVNAFEGVIHYPSSSMSVESITFSGQKNDKNGKILFNDSNVETANDFSGGVNVITVVFNVTGTYSAADIYGEMTDFYSTEIIATGNFPFDYANVIDGTVVSCGHTDLDTPANSYANTAYTVTYSYKDRPSAENTSYTKTVWSNATAATTIASNGIPRISNPYYENYYVNAASKEGTSVFATLEGQTKKYLVSLDGVDQGEFEYLASATVETEEEKDFLINGVRVARGTAYSFFVTGDTDITTDASTGTISESASIVNNALYISDDGTNTYVKMELLASATSTDFDRMGVAFAASDRDQADIVEAINNVTAGTDKYNKIAVHNSAVDNPNKSGQYQFIYAPYTSITKVNKDKSLYFYSYVVNLKGAVTVSAPTQVKFANVLA